MFDNDPGIGYQLTQYRLQFEDHDNHSLDFLHDAQKLQYVLHHKKSKLI